MGSNCSRVWHGSTCDSQDACLDLQPALRCASCAALAADDMICTHKHGQQLPQHLCRQCSTSATSGKLVERISLHEAAALPCISSRPGGLMPACSAQGYMCLHIAAHLRGREQLLQQQGSHQLRPYSRAQPARRMGQDSRVMPSGPKFPTELCPTIDRFGRQSTSLSYPRPDLNFAMQYHSDFGALGRQHRDASCIS